MFEIPEAFRDIGYLEGPELYLWFISIGVLWLGFVLFMIKAPKIELKSQKMHYIAFGFFSLMFGLTRLLFIIAIFIPDNYDFYTTLGYITSLVGIIFFLYVLETYLIQKKTKRIFFLISLITFIISTIALFGGTSRYLALQIQYILLPIVLGAVALLYFYLIVKTTGALRKKIIGILLGMVLIALAQILDSEAFITAFPIFPFIIPPLVLIGGTILFYVSQLYYKE